jgi:hypothetical protein
VRMRGIPVGYTRWPGIPLEQQGEFGNGLLTRLREVLAKYGHVPDNHR